MVAGEEKGKTQQCTVIFAKFAMQLYWFTSKKTNFLLPTVTTLNRRVPPQNTGHFKTDYWGVNDSSTVVITMSKVRCLMWWGNAYIY